MNRIVFVVFAMVPMTALADVKATVDKAEKSYFAAKLDEAAVLLDQAEREEMASPETSP